jgi:hypothetical protein
VSLHAEPRATADNAEQVHGLADLQGLYEGPFRHAWCALIEGAAANDNETHAKGRAAAHILARSTPTPADRPRADHVPPAASDAMWVICNVSTTSAAAYVATYCPSKQDPRSIASNCASTVAMFQTLPASCGQAPTGERDVTMFDAM